MEDILLSEDSYLLQLSEECKKVQKLVPKLGCIQAKEGFYFEYRVETGYEAFEFNIEDSVVTQLYHIHRLHHHIRNGGLPYHRQFKRSLPIGLTLEEVVIFIAEHSTSKFVGRVIFNQSIRNKTQKYFASKKSKLY